jgi:hypothetical protein
MLPLIAAFAIGRNSGAVSGAKTTAAAPIASPARTLPLKISPFARSSKNAIDVAPQPKRPPKLTKCRRVPATAFNVRQHHRRRRMSCDMDRENRPRPVLGPETCPVWLGEEPADPSQLNALLAPYPSEGMTCWPVSTRVGNVNNNDASLIEPVAAVD